MSRAFDNHSRHTILIIPRREDAASHQMMAVDFEWRSDQGQPGHTPPVSDEPQRWNWRRWAFIVVVLLVAAALGFFLWRRGRLQTLAEFEQAVVEVAQLELRALADGDTELYMSLQDSADAEWYAGQQARAQAGEPLPPPLPGLIASPPLTFEHPIVIGDRARVEFIRLAGRQPEPASPFRGVAFYRRLPDGHWVHTAPDADYGGRVLVWTGPRNSLAGHIVNTKLMEQLASELELRADLFCTLLTCAPDLRFSLSLTGTLENVCTYPATVLPAPHLVGAPDDDSAKILWAETLRGIMAEQMLARTVGEPSGGLVGAALRMKVSQYLDAAPTAVLPDPIALGEALSQGQLPSPAQLWATESSEQADPLAAGEAMLLADFVEQHYGREGVAALLRATAEAASWDALLQTALGTDAASFEQQWLDYLSVQITRQTS